MAAYRKVSVTFWSDPFIESLTPEGKYFYLFLMTNVNTTQCGIYEITVRQMVVQTGYNEETIIKLISQFEKAGKIKYSKTTKEMALKNWPKYNASESPKVQTLVDKELSKVKNRVLIQYLYSMDTHPQETETETETKEELQTEVLPHGDLFANAWCEWKKFRKQKKQALTPLTIKKQLEKLLEKNENEAVAMIQQSILNGWTGIFDLKSGQYLPNLEKKQAFDLSKK